MYSWLKAKRMRYVVDCVMSWSTVFSHYPTNGKVFRENVIEQIFGLPPRLFLKHFSLHEEFSEISQPYTGLHVKYPLFLLRF